MIFWILWIVLASLTIVFFVGKHFLGEISSEKVVEREKRLLRLCPALPPNLVGPLPVAKSLKTILEEGSVESRLSTKELRSVGSGRRQSEAVVGSGGHFQPKDCVSNHRIALIIPFRDRDEHLTLLLLQLFPILKRQLLDFQIFVVELETGIEFNRAALRNAGFMEAAKVRFINHHGQRRES